MFHASVRNAESHDAAIIEAKRAGDKQLRRRQERRATPDHMTRTTRVLLTCDGRKTKRGGETDLVQNQESFGQTDSDVRIQASAKSLANERCPIASSLQSLAESSHIRR